MKMTRLSTAVTLTLRPRFSESSAANDCDFRTMGLRSKIVNAACPRNLAATIMNSFIRHLAKTGPVVNVWCWARTAKSTTHPIITAHFGEYVDYEDRCNTDVRVRL